MKNYNKKEVLKQYEESGRIIYQSTMTGEYKKGNKEGKKLLNIYKYFEKNREFALDCINELLKSENVVIRTKAAAYCLALNENIEMAEEILTEISSKKENGIFRLNAEMTLKVWKEKGYLKIYQEK